MIDEKFDTLYFGGGTPSLLGAEKISKIIKSVSLSENAEITLESNPNIDFLKWKDSGINRLSLGMQSANEKELTFLGRKHSLSQVEKSINSAKSIGIKNISLDLMIGIEGMSKDSLLRSIDFCESQDVTHISSYMLKIEENTEFHKNRNILILPDDDYVSDLYLFMVEELEKRGYRQYEISNFSKENFESRHNLKYWNCEEYKALGPSAHSFEDGKRMFFPRDLNYYLEGNKAEFDSFGGDFEEFAMLKLRLSKGITRKDCQTFGEEYFNKMLKNTKKVPKDMIKFSNDKISLSPKGFLLSNSIILTLLS